MFIQQRFWERARSKVLGKGITRVLFFLVVGIIGLGNPNETLSDEASKWQFKKGPAYIEDWDDSEFSQPTYDDSDWQKVNVPADWEKIGLRHEFNPEHKCWRCKKGEKGHHAGWPGLGWYRLHVKIPEEWKGEGITLYLGKIKTSDSIFFNGKKVGAEVHYTHIQKHEVPPEYINYGKDNLIAIRCGSWSGHPYHGGIYEGPLKISSKLGAIYLPSLLTMKVFQPVAKHIKISLLPKYELPESGPELTAKEYPGDDNKGGTGAIFITTGRRCVVGGSYRKHHGGHGEFYVASSPFISLVKDFELIFKSPKGVFEGRRILQAEDYIKRPESTIVSYKGPDFEIRRINFVPMYEPAALFLLDIDTREELGVEVKFKINFEFYRAQKPLENVEIGWSEELNAWVARQKEEKYYLLVGANLKNEAKITRSVKENKFVDLTDEVMFQFKLKPEEIKDNYAAFFVIISMKGEEELANTYREVSSRFKEYYFEKVKYYENFDKETLIIKTPDEKINEGFRWAKIHGDQCFIETPGLGGGFWQSMGSEALGFAYFSVYGGYPYPGACGEIGRSLFHSDMEFFEKFQAKNGNMPGEIRPPKGGCIHPPPPRSLGFVTYNYYWDFLWTGDVDYIREHWSTIKKIVELVYSTDKDGDFILDHAPWGENAHCVGLEIPTSKLRDPPLGMYTILKRGSLFAKFLNKAEEYEKWSGDAKKIEEIFKRDWWDEEKKWIPTWRTTDGENVVVYMSNYIGFLGEAEGLLDKERIDYMLKAYSSPEFLTAQDTVWAIGRSDPHVQKAKYTLATSMPGQNTSAALTFYKYHYPETAYRLARRLLGMMTERDLGTGYETWHPTKEGGYIWGGHRQFVPASEWIMVVLLQGVLGVEPNAPEGEFAFQPHLPLEWDCLTLKNLRVGDSNFDIELRRGHDEKAKFLKMDLIRKEGRRIDTVVLSPSFPKGSDIKEVLVNGKRFKKYRLIRMNECTHCEARLRIGKQLEVLYK